MGRGAVYWLTIGWLWEPTKFTGRMMLWICFFPLGIWRSVVRSRRKTDRISDNRIVKAMEAMAAGQSPPQPPVETRD